MKQIILPGVLLLVSQLPHYLFAQAEFFGYFESEVDQMRSRGTDYSFGYNKVRLDLEVSPLDEVTFRGNLNYQLFQGQGEWNLFDFLPSHIADRFASYGMTEFLFALQDTFYLDNASLRVSFPKFDLTVGKQQLSPGTGYAWNPLDIFNRKDLLDPTYEQTGVNAVRGEILLADRFTMDLILAAEESWESSTKMVRSKLGVSRFDIVASYGTFQWARRGVTFDSTDSDFPVQKDVVSVERQMIGGATVGELLGLGLWAEGSWNILKNADDFAEYLVGCDYTFDFQTYLLMEYYHNDNGILDSDSLRLNDYLYYFDGATHSLMQDYLFLFVNHPVTDLLNIGLFGIANFNDNSAMVNPQLEYNLFEDVNLSLLVSFSVGDQDSEFGVQDWGVRLRLRAYF